MIATEKITMFGVTEYAEGYHVTLTLTEPDKVDPNQPRRIIIEALNEGGCNLTQVDLIKLLAWVKENRREIWDSI